MYIDSSGLDAARGEINPSGRGACVRECAQHESLYAPRGSVPRLEECRACLWLEEWGLIGDGRGRRTG